MTVGRSYKAEKRETKSMRSTSKQERLTTRQALQSALRTVNANNVKDNK
jgi:hypothetical protein